MGFKKNLLFLKLHKKDPKLRRLLIILTILTVTTILGSCGTDKKPRMNIQEIKNNFDRQYSESMKDQLFALDLDSVKSKQGDDLQNCGQS